MTSLPTEDESLREKLGVWFKPVSISVIGDYGNDTHVRQLSWLEFTTLIQTSNQEAYRQGGIDELKNLTQMFDEHAKSIGLWGMGGLALDTLVMNGIATSEQKAERDAMVTERRALAVLHGTVNERLTALTTKADTTNVNKENER